MGNEEKFTRNGRGIAEAVLTRYIYSKSLDYSKKRESDHAEH
jgi:hypothetical protein